MARRWQITVGGKTIWVESQVEERFLHMLESNGFSKRWEKPEKGLHFGGKNYTPDVYLLIEHEGLSHRAIVEVKSVLNDHRYGFNDYIFGRMRKVAGVYHSKMLLLYVEASHTWYRIDNKTGELTNFGMPVPAKIPVSKSYKPLLTRSNSVYSHNYNQRFDRAAAKSSALGFMSIVEEILHALLGPSKSKRRNSSKKHRH